MPVFITDEMRRAAEIESKRRNDFIKHHFDLAYMTGGQRDVVGFLGEFACKEYLGLDWRAGIRKSYETIDKGDILIPGITADIKTETMSSGKLTLLLNGRIGDDAPYGRRLINQGQVGLLEHYDYVIWGAFPRNLCNWWYPLGYLDTKHILENYKVTEQTPFGSQYPEPCLNIRHSELKDIDSLKKLLEQRKA